MFKLTYIAQAKRKTRLEKNQGYNHKDTLCDTSKDWGENRNGHDGGQHRRH